ncbi:tail fiber assembly protein [Providencia stuartii]|uniref:tail fiber assembly protein n=1 Tax=Providencia stuartii TaxID=588 RepID=UPI002AA0B20E|nr:tail fiber assembly protein [Providencia stuartii]
MKYFKDKNNEIYAYESDGSQDAFICDELIRISEQEALKITTPAVSQQQLRQEAEQQKKILLSEVTKAIAPLQDAVDLRIATEAERAALQEWKKYRILLSRVDTSTAPNIDWPEKP